MELVSLVLGPNQPFCRDLKLAEDIQTLTIWYGGNTELPRKIRKGKFNMFRRQDG